MLAQVSNSELSLLLLVQIAVILAACRLVGVVARWLGQPAAVAEMIAGIVLGPSVFGLIAPGAQAWLFPAESRTVIYCVAQVGLAVYMFLVGVEFRSELVWPKAKCAASVSIAGILVPCVLGGAIAWWCKDDPRMFTDKVGTWDAVLYLGAAMSITAFPILARIIRERGLGGTTLGALALTAGSMNDAAAWCILAVVLSSVTGEPWTAAKAIGGGVAYVALCLLVVRPLLTPLGARVERAGGASLGVIGVLLIGVLTGAALTELLGLHAVFGAFVLGLAIPRGKLATDLENKLGPAVTTLLVPLYFVNTGLNTKIGLLDSWPLVGLALVILVAATLGKGVACFAAARMHGESTRTSVALGALMNARGLMELIILNIGYERGLISQTLYSIMVLMAVMTTLMATPVFELALGRKRMTDLP